MSQPYNTPDKDRRLRQAHNAALIFSVTFTSWAGIALLLAATRSFARAERLGFAAVTAAAALSLWTIYAFICQATSGNIRPMWPVRLWRRLMVRLRTPRH